MAKQPLTIDCGDCVMAGTTACDDCIVSFIVNREPGDAVVVDADEERALRALSDGRPRAALAPPVEVRLSERGYRSALAKLRRSIAPVPVALMPRATMLTSQPSACARSAPTVQFSLPPSVENGSYL